MFALRIIIALFIGQNNQSRKVCMKINVDIHKYVKMYVNVCKHANG